MASSIPWRTFLPTEHGSWGFVLEPLALGLLIAPTVGGWAGAVGFLLLFLAYRPLSLGLSDVRRGRRHPRTAAGIATGWLAAAAAAALLAFLWQPSLRGNPWPAVAVYGISLGCYAAAAENKPHRDLPRKLSGAIAAAPTATLVALTHPGLSVPVAYSLAGFMLLRTVPSLFYVRERLEMNRGKPPRRNWVLGWHVGAFGAAWALCALASMDPLAAGAFALLGVRSMLGLRKARRSVQPKVVGLQEVAWGLVTVVLVAFAV